jgi:soluble lytic murein transglycosylase-like protein
MIRLFSLLFILISAQSFAEVPPYYQQVSVRLQIPATILYAIAMQESRPPNGLIEGIDKPWPWTLNCEGQGYYFPSRQAAFNVASLLINLGESCDIGLMQVSWVWHKKRFNSLNEAFDPVTNIQAGSDYLKELYEKSGSWEYAVGAYHSPSDPVKSKQYREKVRTHLTRIMGVAF